MTNPETKKDKKLILIALCVVLVVVGLWYLTIYFLKDQEPTARGTFGDMFGAVNALFSGLAFSGIIFTILLQREELSLQRQELQETRNELKRSADAQERSEKALINQQNQTTFFNLLEQQKKLLETIKLNDSIGFEGIREFATEVRKNLMSYVKMEKDGLFPKIIDTSKHPYNAIKYNKSQISTYLKNMQTIVSFIETGLSNDELFHSILYSYISVPEKYLLGIYYYYGSGFETEFLKKNFNYIEYYETSLEKYKNESDKYFPTLKIYPKGYTTFYNETLASPNSILQLNITPIFDCYNKMLSLKSVDYEIIDRYTERTLLSESMTSIIQIDQNETNINADVSNFIRQIAHDLRNSDYIIEYKFSFNYGNKTYNSTYSHGLYKTTDVGVDEENDYVVVPRYVLTDFE